jgi:hypothetical protein
MTKGDVQEALVTLYLRLNGYFTTGFIAQSDTPGQVTTELDVLAVRLPHNKEPERIVGGAEELDRWDGGLDFIIGEVKSRGQKLQFNDGARTDLAVSKFLQWWGHLSPEEVAAKTPSVLAILQPQERPEAAPTVLCPRDARVRAILFSPERLSRRPQQAWFIPGPPIFGYIWKCLRPDVPRPTCATNYGAGQWGVALAPVVSYFKDSARTQPGTLGHLLNHLGTAASPCAGARTSDRCSQPVGSREVAALTPC